jgi:phosphate/sulfate permease
LNLTPVLLFLTSFVFSANNIGVIRPGFQGTAYRRRVLYLGLTALGFALGFFAEGYKVGSGIVRDISPPTQSGLELSLLVTLLVMGAFTLLRLPSSISNVAVGALLGPLVASGGLPPVGPLTTIVVAWLVAPATAALLSLAIYAVHNKVIWAWPLLKVSMFNRYFGILAILLSSYTLSANNLGMLTSFGSGALDSALILIAALLGVFILSNLVASTMGWKLAVLTPGSYSSALLGGSVNLWVYTQLGIPASLTQSVVAGVMVLSLVTRPSVVNTRTMFEILGSWPFFLAISFVAAFGAWFLL